MSSPQTKSRTPLLAGVALTVVVLSGAYIAHIKGAFSSPAPLPPAEIGALPTYTEPTPLPQEAAPALAQAAVPMQLEAAPLHPDAVGPETAYDASLVEPPPANAVPAPEAGLSSELVNLMELRRRAELGRARVDSLRVDIETKQAEELLHGTATGANQLPELVGLSGAAPRLTAEFLAGNRIIQARRGDWLSKDWQITEVLASGVRMTRRGGKDTRMILFGDTPMEFSASPASAAPMPLQQPYITER